MMSNSEKTIRRLCADGCGFYGCDGNHSLCSGCYNDYLREKISIMLADVPGMQPLPEVVDEANRGRPLPTSNDKVTFVIQDSQSHKSHDLPMLSMASSSKGRTKERLRCKVCEKRVGLLRFICQYCEDVFGGSHRHTEDHACSVNLKSIAGHALAEQNPVVKSDKLGFRG